MLSGDVTFALHLSLAQEGTADTAAKLHSQASFTSTSQFGGTLTTFNLSSIHYSPLLFVVLLLPVCKVV